jgi:hypothetical protein
MKARILAASLTSILCASSFAALGQGKACTLATPAELEAVLGGKATLAPAMMGTVEACNGKVGATSVIIRLLKRTGDPSGKTELASIEPSLCVDSRVCS